jgi:heme/copper-type cytochrome/quinol oxidase subunit 2
MPKAEEELLPPKPPKKQPAFSKKILWAIPLLIVLGIAVPKFLTKKNVSPPEKKETRINWVKYTGQVVRRNGEPAPNVRLLFKKGDLIKETFADEKGRYSIELPEKLANVTLEIYFREKLVMPPRNLSADPKVLDLLKIPD